MSSMLSLTSLFRTSIALGAVTLSSLAIAPDAHAQNRGNLVAQQPNNIAQGIERWEVLQKRKDLSFADYSGFVLTYPEFPRENVLRIRAENALENEAPGPEALVAFFDRLPPLTNAGRARYALSLAALQRPEALEVARAAWRGGTMSGPAEAYLLGLYGGQFTAEDHAERMDMLLWQRDGEAATRHVVNIAPEQREAAMARLALVNGSTPAAAGQSVPANAMSDPGHVYNLGRYYRGKRQLGAAADLYANRPAFSRPAPVPADMVEEMLRVAKSAGSSQAVRIASKVDDLFAPGFDVSSGSFTLRDKYTDLMWLGGTKALWNMGDGAAAAPLFYRYGAGAGTSLIRAKGFYWAGRAAQQAGMMGEANRYYEMAADYPEYYYGQLALSALGRPMPSFAQLPELDITAAKQAEFEQRPVVRALRQIAANRQKWQTERRFFQAVSDSAKTPVEMALVAQLAAETGLEEFAVVAGMNARGNGFAGFERLGFPIVATPGGTDWTMVHAISRQESEFDRFRISHAGARGVMQLMPGTAREQAGKLGLTYMSANLINSPNYNIRLGDAYFARMMDYYGGAYPLAVGAYNAGPGRVNQWLRLNGDPRRGDIDWVTWVERIPANFETRYYIMRVLGNAVTYSHMYPELAGRPRPINSFLP